MIKNRKHGHIGIATNNIDADAKWYVDVLGFEVIGDFHTPDGVHAIFMKNQDVIVEMFQPHEPILEAAAGKIDHYAFDSQDIEADYKFCVEQGYRITTDGIEGIPTFWKNGVKYFKIASPTGEEMEFCQVL